MTWALYFLAGWVFFLLAFMVWWKALVRNSEEDDR